jgi:VanZ family protein
MRFEVWHFYIRKGGHVVGYGILSILLFAPGAPPCPAMGCEVDAALGHHRRVGTAFVASLDEWHQSFIPSRTGTLADVVLDTCAGIAAQFLIFLWWKNFGKGTTSVVPLSAENRAL